MEPGTPVNTPRGLGVVKETTPSGQVVVKLLEDFRRELVTEGLTSYFYAFEESDLTIALVSWGSKKI